MVNVYSEGDVYTVLTIVTNTECLVVWISMISID